ncbi:MAG: NUDIX domain-containing protein [Hyphomicrobiaceae bacterium]
MTETGGIEEGRVRLISQVKLREVKQTWEFGTRYRREIDANWQRGLRENPGYFNGRVFMLTKGENIASGFAGELMAVDFKDFIYWRDHPDLDTTVYDCFGSALVVSCDGAIMLGRQRNGNINAGLTYFPGGFIDERDVGLDGGIDIRQSVLREVLEETGLEAHEFAISPSLLLTTIGNQVSIGVELASPLTAVQLRRKVAAHLASDPDGELEGVVVAKSHSDLSGHQVPAYARCLVRHYLPQ